MNDLENDYHEIDYDQILSKHAEKALFLLSILGIPGLSLLSWGNFKIDLIAGFSYIPAILVMVLCLAAIGLNPKKMKGKTPRFYADAFACCAVMGAAAVVIRASMIDFPLKTSPIQFALFMSLPLCFHSRSRGLVRNAVITITTVLVIGAYDINLLASIQSHFYFGFFAGTIIHFISEDRMYKDFLYQRSLEREKKSQSKQARLISKELQERCLPHQLERISAGFAYEETMPCYEADFWASCLHSIYLGEITGEDRHPSDQDQFRKFNHTLRKNIQDAFAINRNHKNTNSLESKFQNHGFLARSVDEKCYVSYNYPFPFKEDLEPAQIIIKSILLQFLVHMRVSQVFNQPENFCAMASLTYGPGQGKFSGSLSNYELDGKVIMFSDRYLNARFQVSEVAERLQQGFYTVIMSEACYATLAKSIDSYFPDQVYHYRVIPHIRDDANGSKINVMYFHRDSIESLIEKIESSGSLRTRLAA